MDVEHQPSMKILSISCVYPNPSEPGLGRFVQRRLQHLAAFAEAKVIAPVPFLHYVNLTRRIIRKRNQACLYARMDGKVEVIHPRWLYPPFGGVLNAFCLFLRLFWLVIRLKSEFPFRIIDVHFGYPEGIAGALLAKVFRAPYTITLRGSETMHAQHLFRRWGMSWALRKADRVFAVSGNLHRLAVGLGAHPARVKTIPNGVDPVIFFLRDREECRRKHRLPLDAYLILSAGHLIELKGHHHVIRALRVLLDEGLAVQLLIAGGFGHRKSSKSELQKQVIQLGLESSVRFLGEVPQEAMAELMCASDILTLASAREGCPNVVLEALACGTPVVATSVGAVPELVTTGRDGLVIPDIEPETLAQALRLALTTPWDRKAISARGQCRSWKDVARELHQEITAVLLEQGPLQAVPEKM